MQLPFKSFYDCTEVFEGADALKLFPIHLDLNFDLMDDKAN